MHKLEVDSVDALIELVGLQPEEPQFPRFIRGASPLGLPYTRSRPPLRRRAPSRGSLAAARSLTSVSRLSGL